MPTINLNCKPIYTTVKISDTIPAEIYEINKIIHSVTSARPSGYIFMPNYKNGNWDGYIKLYNGSRFPTGLVRDVYDALVPNGYNITLTNTYDTLDCGCRVIDPAYPDMFEGITLRDYQIKAIKTLLRSVRGIAKMATNSGKTEIIAAIAKAMPGRVLILTTKKDILYQTIDRLGMRIGESIGILGDGKLNLQRITVGMIQTLHSRLDKLDQTVLNNLDCVMYDEVHHIVSKTSQKVMYAIDAPYRFGFSGTPLSYDKLSDLVLIGATGPIVVEVTNEELVNRGISAKPSIKMHTITIPNQWGESYQDAYHECIVINPERNYTLHGIVDESNAKSTLILVERLKHGKLLNRLIQGSIFVSGSTDMKTRSETLDLLREGSGAVVIATPIFEEGVDVPAVDLLVMAGGGKGHKKLLQRIGRGMRKKKGENVLRVIDFWDNTNKFLLRHSKRRMIIYKQEGFEVEVIE